MLASTEKVAYVYLAPKSNDRVGGFRKPIFSLNQLHNEKVGKKPLVSVLAHQIGQAKREKKEANASRLPEN